ncbi:MAG: hypothetical protein RID91_15040 [Azospirillaceae bacterium]
MPLYDYDRRYRRRVWGTITRIGFYVATIAVTALFAYRTGIEQSAERERRLDNRVAELESSLAAAEQNAIRLEAAARTARIQYEELMARFEAEVPRGERRELLNLVSARLEEGVAPDRLAFFVRSAAPPTDCTEAESRRFIAATPTYDGPNTAIGFADGRITVTGEGENAVSEGGSVQGWYDPAMPVTMAFTRIGGEREEVEGKLPLHHTLVLDGAEWRFTATEGDRSMINVAADRCVFPESPPMAQGSADPTVER